jgi:hypothetical protein
MLRHPNSARSHIAPTAIATLLTESAARRVCLVGDLLNILDTIAK